MNYQLRIARPVLDLTRATEVYCRGLDLLVLDRFEDHQGFDGVMLGGPGLAYHLELTRHRSHPILPAPTPEDLLVFYIPDPSDWMNRCRQMTGAGFQQVNSFNPYWDVRGKTFADPDGYRLVLENDAWLQG